MRRDVIRFDPYCIYDVLLNTENDIGFMLILSS